MGASDLKTCLKQKIFLNAFLEYNTFQNQGLIKQKNLSQKADF